MRKGGGIKPKRVREDQILAFSAEGGRMLYLEGKGWKCGFLTDIYVDRRVYIYVMCMLHEN